jgi:hypothetical protein
MTADMFGPIADERREEANAVNNGNGNAPEVKQPTRVMTISQPGQTCGKCNTELAIGTKCTWAPSATGVKWRCFTCCPPPAGAPKPAAARPIPDVPETQPPAGDAISVLASALLPHIEAKLKTKVDSADLESKVADMVESMVQDAIATLRPSVRLVIEDKTKNELRKIDGAHPKLRKACIMLMAGLNTYLYGPPGGGKTHSFEQIAEALGVKLTVFQVGKMSS